MLPFFRRAFLVRESSVSGGYVVSYSYNGRTFHAQALPDRDSSAEELGQTIVFFSLDEGKTR